MADEKEKQTQPETNEDEREPRLYELGYHIIPSITPELLGEEITKIKDAIEAHGGIIVSEEMPRMINLSYPIVFVPGIKRGTEVKKTYHTAHFGWVRFQMRPENRELFGIDVSANEHILRYIIIRTTQEKMASPKRMTFLAKSREMPSREKKKAEKSQEKPMSDEELDKTIEDLIVE